MPTTTRGPSPDEFYENVQREILNTVNIEAANISRSLTRATPVGVGGQLSGGWVFSPATSRSPVAVVANSQSYLLPVELGRKPGKGISAEGQDSVTLWARRKLGLSETEGRSLAYLLSRKYKREGRPAQGFMGLARPGDSAPGGQADELEPVAGGLLAKAFADLDQAISRVTG